MLTQIEEHSAQVDDAPALAALKIRFHRFLDLARSAVQRQPWLVVIAMHEYARCIYPADPYLPFDEDQSSTERVTRVLDSCIGLLESAAPLGSYFEHQADAMAGVLAEHSRPPGRRRDEEATQQVYGRLWDDLDTDAYLSESVELMEARLRNSGVQRASFSGKVVLDLGCGSGRHTMAMAMAQAERAHGVDLGAASLETATSIAARAGLGNVEFRVGDALDLPYEDSTFDFIWCNGVLHHTKDLERGINELHRVLKSRSQAFLYLYGDGGLFWYSRKQMRPIMQRIPQEYTLAILTMIGMPKNRFIFADNWYVPIERHTTRAALEAYLSQIGFCSLQKIVGTRPTDLDRAIATGDPEAQLIWGDGEHRYLITKG
ncbi:MAG: class I SAM-dependent methyltransferase [Phycisphaerales bacterium]